MLSKNIRSHIDKAQLNCYTFIDLYFIKVFSKTKNQKNGINERGWLNRMREYFLEAREIEKSFGGVHALKRVNLKIRSGETLCLVGQNGCGKSTLIKIISGAYKPDAGEIVIDGVAHQQMTPLRSTHAGIQVIYQDLSLFHNLTVSENVAMAYNLSGAHKRLFSKKRNREKTLKVLGEIGVDIDPDAIVDDLPIAQRQIVAICRALTQDAKLIIMDEPTTALTSHEVDRLYKVIAGLKARGIALIFVSHKLDEVVRIADRIMVMRNGENIIDGPVNTFDTAKITFYMTGRELSTIPFDNPIDHSRPILSVRGLTARSGAFRDISFELYQGEVLGVTGLLGSGREALAEALFGLCPLTSGQIQLLGKSIALKNATQAVKSGIGYIPEDRTLKGLYMKAPIGENIFSSILYLHSSAGFLKFKELDEIARYEADKLSIKAAGIEAPANSLSGGNQQRVVIAKWLALKPKLLILNCPTVGVDVGSKAEIHALARAFARDGIGVLLISDDLPEILAACNRVLVMNQGILTGCYDTNQIDEQSLQTQLTKEIGGNIA